MTDVMTACQKEQEIILWWNRYLVICYTPRKRADFLLLFLPLEEKKLSFFALQSSRSNARNENRDINEFS